MHWSIQTVILWIALGIMLLTMGLLDIKFGSNTRKGWLPYPTSRGDRLFISLMFMVGIGVIWLFTMRYQTGKIDGPGVTMWVPFGISFVVGAIIIKYA